MQTKEKVKQVKGNIPLDNELLNRYASVKYMFEDASRILSESDEIKIYYCPEIIYVNISTIQIFDAKLIANRIFNKYHMKNIFINDGNKIIVSKKSINESIVKIYHNRVQRDLLKEHLAVFANLEIIIKNAKLVSQTLERKGRRETIYWNYYLDKLYINDKCYFLEFEVRSMNNGQNQYRIQRLELSI